MLTSTEQYIIDLLKKSIIPSAATPVMPKDADPDIISAIICSNGILLTVYPTLMNDDSSVTAVIVDKLKNKYYQAVKQSVMQDNEGRHIQSALSNAGLDLIALKGWELRKLYPDITRRSMADLDILVRNYDYKKINEVMTGLGYEGHGSSSWKHDEFSKDEITVEMHKRLTDDSDYIQAWERRMWANAVSTSDNNQIYMMSDEDYYIFHFLHLHKDIKNGSLGLRRIADTWLYKNAYPDMDRDYLNSEFDKMDILLFVQRIEKLADDCFTNDSIDDNSQIMLKHAMNAGIYGNGKSYKLGRIASMSDGSLKSGKRKSFWTSIFLPYSRMKAQFPILEKWTVLLPFLWIKRIFNQAKKYRRNKAKLDYSDISEEEFEQMREFFRAGGVME